MSQSPSKTIQNGDSAGERLLDLYTVQEIGNSRTVTIPSETGLEPKTVLCMRLGRQNGRIVYLKAIEQDRRRLPPAPHLSDTSARNETSAEAVQETGHEFREVRGNQNEKMMTIPAEYGDDGAFALKSRVAMLAGYTTNSSRYLRIVPEDVLAERLRCR